MLKHSKKRHHSHFLSRFSGTFSTRVKDRLKRSMSKRRSKKRLKKKVYPLSRPIGIKNVKKKRIKHEFERFYSWLNVRRKIRKKRYVWSKILKRKVHRSKYRLVKVSRAYSFVKYQATLIISRSRTNFFFTVVDKNKKPIFKISTGRISNNSRRRAVSPYTFELMAPYILECLKVYKLKAMNIIWKIYSPRHMHTFMREMRLRKIKITRHTFRLTVPHNGVRPSKRPRK